MADVMKKAVRLTFSKGARLADPASLFNARLTGDAVRAIDFFEDSEFSDDQLRRLVLRAVAENRQD